MFIYILFCLCSHYCTTVSYTLRELFGPSQLSLKKYLCVNGVFVFTPVTVCLSYCHFGLVSGGWLGSLAAT